MVMHKLEEQGVVALDDPVAAHLPDFARHGKGDITIRQVLTLLNRSGLHCRFEGSGMAVSQEPVPGTVITPGTTCVVKFKSGKILK